MSSLCSREQANLHTHIHILLVFVPSTKLVTLNFPYHRIEDVLLGTPNFNTDNPITVLFFQGIFIYLFIIFGCIGSSLRCVGFSLRRPPLLRSTGSRLAGSRAQAQQLWRTGPAAPRHVGSSWTRARTQVPCTGRWTPNHCATREVPPSLFLIPGEADTEPTLSQGLTSLSESSVLGTPPVDRWLHCGLGHIFFVCTIYLDA